MKQAKRRRKPLKKPLFSEQESKQLGYWLDRIDIMAIAAYALLCNDKWVALLAGVLTIPEGAQLVALTAILLLVWVVIGRLKAKLP